MINKFIDSALALAFFSAILYCAYNRYLNGYFSVFGIDPTLMDQNMHRVLFSGLHVIFVPLFNLVAKIFIPTILVFSILYGIKDCDFIYNILNSNFVFELSNGIRSLFTLKDNFVYIKSIIFYLFIIIVVMILSSKFLDYFKNKGEIYAKEVIDKIKKEEFKEDNVKFDFNYNEKSVFLIACDSLNCIGYCKSDKKIYFFDKNKIKYIDVKNL